MSEENVAVVRAMLEAFLRRDLAAISPLVADDVEWDTTRIGETVPDLAGVFRGPEGSRALWSSWLSPWSEVTYDYELRDAGERVAALISNQHQIGRHSGVVTEIQPYTWVYSLQHGKVKRACWYPDHATGLQAAGRPE